MTEQRLLSDRYRIQSHLARGGMADVFQAEDELLGRQVAVKILHPQFASDEAFVTRFRREAQQAAGLSHPNIVSIYDWGEDQDTYYMVMELIEGRTLRDIRRSEGPLLARRAAEIAAETAAALTVAHQAGVYHRDVKPGNIMLTPKGSVKVTDFGIARALDDSAELTRTGAVIGTATYFSPEQAQGLPADERSDVYSLGVVLYELLCGVAPFTGESPVAVAYQHVSEYAEPPSAINPDVPAELESIVEKAMEKDPALRYQTADDMRKDLLLYLKGETPLVMAASAAAGASLPAAAGVHAPISDAATQMMPLPAATVPPDEAGRSVAQPMPEHRSQTGYLVAIFGLLLALALGVFFLTRLLSSSPAETVTVAVPDVTDWARLDAVEELAIALDFKVRERIQVSDSVATGFVIATDPVAGTNVDPDSIVIVIVSAGPQQFAIPNVLDSTEEAARALLEAGEFAIGVVSYRFSDTVPEGIVISQSPRPGTEGAPGTEVDLEVSSGPFALTVPDVRLVTEESALTALADASISDVEVVREFSAEILEGFVIRTEPGAGELVSRDRTVILVVSDGPEPFELPNLVGMSVADAQQAALNRGLIFILEDDTEPVTFDSGLVGLVAAQTPGGGTEVIVGDEIRVRLGSLIQRTVPDLTGLTQEEAEALLADLGLTLEIVGDTPVEPDSGLDGLIAAQDEAVDSQVDDGSTIHVRMGIIVPPPTDPPDEGG
ncbi:MAG: Stk1 family PASTA domain-containing Ser/Thr kinase [bacterium]|nr:Stk1 family PASTA domain-containing Ser/Thr kinase [bacterium]